MRLRRPRSLPPRWRPSSLPLRSRLALLTAAAVAAAVAAVAVTSWFIARAQLDRQLDTSLRESQIHAPYIAEALAFCSAADQSGNGPPGPGYTQIVRTNGSPCVAPGSQAVKVQQADIQVANGLRTTTMHDSATTGGRPVRVYTQLVRLRSATGPDTFVAVSLSRPLEEVTRPLDRLALVLFAVGGIGVLGATSAGLGIARAGLRPVDRLTGAVEHIARTEDLAIRIPVEGEDEIARLSAAFNSMTAQLAASRDRQQQLIADAGHELRTPLTSLRTNIDLLARSEETGRPIPAEDRKALLASVKAQLSELAALVGDLQELSRPESAPGSGPTQIVALHEIAEHAVERARLRGPDLKILAELAPWYVRAEPASLERALVNLLDNAVKFSPSGGTVQVRLYGGEFSVQDQGPGIPPEELPHVFERFWRSPSARSLPGSGLGLSIVARTVQQGGGTVALRPAQGRGTIAVVRLPGAPAAPPEPVTG